jgi:RND family efflux transporter MFP subunit
MPDKPDMPATQEQDVLQHHKPRHLRLTGLIVLGVLTSVAALGLVTRVVASRETQGWTKDQATPTVQLVTLKAADGSAFTLPGDIEPFTNATIYAQISGYVQRWFVDIGTTVKAGQLLAQIDPRPYQAALDQAKGNLARDTATLGEAQLDLKRYQVLAAQNAISAQQLTTQEATAKADEGIVETDKAAVETAQINLNYTRIVAPVDGVVTSRSLDVGQLVTAGNASATPLFIVTDQNRLRVYVRMPQSYSGLIHPGMTSDFIVPEHPGRTFTAALVASADAIVSQSGTQLVQFQIDNSDHALKPGDYATMNFGTGKGHGGVRVPVTAVMFRDQGMLVASVGSDGKVAMKPIQIDTDFGTAVEVDAGLKIGDRIIDNPPDSLRPGDAVRIAPSSAS